VSVQASIPCQLIYDSKSQTSPHRLMLRHQPPWIPSSSERSSTHSDRPGTESRTQHDASYKANKDSTTASRKMSLEHTEQPIAGTPISFIKVKAALLLLVAQGLQVHGSSVVHSHYFDIINATGPVPRAREKREQQTFTTT
jgi:hypothetical protein